MTLRSRLLRALEQDGVNFLLTNRIPRRLATRFIGWFSRIEQPLLRDLSIGVWRFFSDLDLSDAKKARFRSMHDCFVRELREGARPVDRSPEILVSPCDAIVGASGTLDGTSLLQIKGSAYSVADLLCEQDAVDLYRNGRYVTLRLTSGMYHRFHAPHDCRIDRVTHIFGDVWNVNPPALRRVEKLYCKNERAHLRVRLIRAPLTVALVPVAAVLVAGIRLKFLPTMPGSGRGRAATVDCDARFAKGDEMGWFEHGSTIVALAPDGFSLCDNVREGAIIRVGQPLMRLPRW
jgi:phosphatidylserine decarboxylase